MTIKESVHPTEDQPVFENQTSVQDIVEEIKLLKNKNAIISQTLFDLSKFVMPLTGMIEMVFLLNQMKLKKILSIILSWRIPSAVHI